MFRWMFYKVRDACEVQGGKIMSQLRKQLNCIQGVWLLIQEDVSCVQMAGVVNQTAALAIRPILMMRDTRLCIIEAMHMDIDPTSQHR